MPKKVDRCGSKGWGVLLCLFSLFLTFSQVRAQSTSLDPPEKILVDFTSNGLTYPQVMDRLSASTNYIFLYNPSIFDGSSRLNFISEGATLQEVLNLLFSETTITWSVSGEYIILKSPLTKAKAKTVTISGKITELQTGEPIIGAQVRVLPGTKGAVANLDGLFTLRLPANDYLLDISSIGHEPQTIQIEIKGDTVLNFELSDKAVELNEVTIYASRFNSNSEYLSVPLSGSISLSQEQIDEVPVFLGEPDPINVLRRMPGISSNPLGLSGLSVRGGENGHNLILIDQVPIYTVNHLFGLFSTVNPSAVKVVEVYKGGIDPSFGGRASSVVNIHTKQGNREKNKTTGSIGTLAANLSIEQPLFKGKGSAAVFARRSYLDLFLQTVPSRDNLANQFNFQDINLKTTYSFSPKNRLTATGYYSVDNIRFTNFQSSRWGNRFVSLNSGNMVGNHLYSNTTLYLSNYTNQNLENSNPSFAFQTNYNLQNLGLKQEFTYYGKKGNLFNSGIELINHHFEFGNVVPLDTSLIAATPGRIAENFEASAFASYGFSPIKNLKIQTGLRFTGFGQISPRTVNQYAQENELTDLTIQDSVGVITIPGTHPFDVRYRLAPRLSLVYVFKNNVTSNLTYDRLNQNLLRIPNRTQGFSADVWAPVNRHLEPTQLDQLSAGLHSISYSDNVEANLAIYYREQRNLIRFNGFSDVLFSNQIETEILSGEGYSIGLEAYLKKEFINSSIWFSYTLSDSRVRFSQLNDFNYFPSDNDRRHDLNINFSRTFEGVKLAASWSYATGAPFTVPTGSYRYQGTLYPIFSDINNYRLPDLHHLDASVTFENFSNKGMFSNSSFVFSIYNLYARKNAYGYVFRTDVETGDLSTFKLYLFSIVPSFSFNFSL